MRIGVLALQGDFAEHEVVLRRLGVETCQVRLAAHLEGLAGLIIPGGESTTIGKLANDFGLMEPLRRFGEQRAIWGTCAGAIFLSKDARREQPLLQLMEISVERNAFGRQVDSFEVDLVFDCLHPMEEGDRPYHTVFIRAPLILEARPGVDVLGRMPASAPRGAGRIIAARQGRLLATSFHPELTGDDRFHRYFLELAQ